MQKTEKSEGRNLRSSYMDFYLLIVNDHLVVSDLDFKSVN